MPDWKIFDGRGRQHDRLTQLPPPPPWRFSRDWRPIEKSVLPTQRHKVSAWDAEEARARAFQPTPEMIQAVNTALYLRRPLLITGKPGTGKSTLISKVAHELLLGDVLRWPINSRSTVRSGVYEYDAIGRLQAGTGAPPPVESYLVLGPLGTAIAASGRPRALLVDEIDKSDLDFANDLLNVIEEGTFDIPELQRIGQDVATVRNAEGNIVEIRAGRLQVEHFPVVVMTSNAERDFPAAFLRRCVRLDVLPPDRTQLEAIVRSQLRSYKARVDEHAISVLIDRFLEASTAGDLSTDQLLNAIFLTVSVPGMRGKTLDTAEQEELVAALLRPITGSDS